MKRIIKWKVLLSLCCIWLAADTKAQLINESFESWCGTVITSPSGSCETFANACMPGWQRSHGSPQVNTSGAPDGNNFVQMWSNNMGSGEGIFASYNFTTGKQYKVCMWVRNDFNLGRLVVRAANGIVAPPDWGVTCAGSVPGVGFEAMYDVPLIWNTGWTRITFDYTPGANYTQFWVFPLSSTGDVVWLNVDDIDIAEICRPDMVFNMTTNTVGGTIGGALYSNVEYIYAGSSAGGGSIGAGTVITAPNASVTFEAGTRVIISPNFRSTPGTGLFHVYINPCSRLNCGNTTFIEGRDGIEGNPAEPYQDETSPNGKTSSPNDLYTGAEVYPNPTTGTLRVITQYDAVAQYEITTITGQVLQKGEVRNNETLNIGEYPPGIYLLKITEGITGRQSTHRIVKQ